MMGIYGLTGQIIEEMRETNEIFSNITVTLQYFVCVCTAYLDR